jgi:hypothetical protein
MAREYKVLVNYKHNHVSVAQSLYTGPHRKHAENAFSVAGALGNHGILANCTVTFFDGFRIREDFTRHFGPDPEQTYVACLGCEETIPRRPYRMNYCEECAAKAGADNVRS